MRYSQFVGDIAKRFSGSETFSNGFVEKAFCYAFAYPREVAGLLYIFRKDVRVAKKLAQIVRRLRSGFMHRIKIAALEIAPGPTGNRPHRIGWLALALQRPVLASA